MSEISGKSGLIISHGEDGIIAAISKQLGRANEVLNGDPNHLDLMGREGVGHTEFLIPGSLIPGGSYFRADVTWTTWAAWAATAPSTTNRQNCRPTFVVEVISPTQASPQQVRDQRLKMQRWILAGVEFGIFVDWRNHRTYRYATAASGHLPGGTPTMNVVFPVGGNAAVAEATTVWPAQAVGAPQFGPPLIVNIPATTQFPLAVAAGTNAAAAAVAMAAGVAAPPAVAPVPIGINHSRFVLSQ